MSSVQVFVDNIENNPKCLHGPTLIFKREQNKQYFACAACRDRKDCSFFLWVDELDKFNETKKQFWDDLRQNYIQKQPCHSKLIQILDKVQQTHVSKRFYCHECHKLLYDDIKKHKSHKKTNVTDHLLKNPTQLFLPKENTKKEAQYLFSSSSIKTFINIFKDLKLKHIVCIGSPRIHEYIQNNLIDVGFKSILLDIDERYRHFFGPMQFCWYNSFNNYFFEGSASEKIFEEFLKTQNGDGVGLITDPPFGGRIEPLALTINTITKKFQDLNEMTQKLPVFLIFPYFMEPQIQNSLPDFQMLDYKVDYDNHTLFSNKPQGRKFGSPVRIFTNVTLEKISLPLEEGYKFCNICNKWVSSENNHCYKCEQCTSKNGTTYVHCEECERCVKPSWKHCSKCNRCVLQDHKCNEIESSQICFHCKLPGHKKSECLNLNVKYKRKRKLNNKNKHLKKVKLN